MLASIQLLAWQPWANYFNLFRPLFHHLQYRAKNSFKFFLTHRVVWRMKECIACEALGSAPATYIALVK